ncbi:hypothetical protein CBM2585_A160333 [Cupriavidus taiwanensis]|nr:hypothetical protein CBM2585_A160333 [Cupriavidus taiwanensis]
MTASIRFAETFSAAKIADSESRLL